ncbi:MmcQ/YjbR family DNA-binding protein [Paucibacter sediminis]|uniref:MmcQ/YjbR family DNA-binding protein n=1 Tax=Paucibacter sediminis TaxID=3019553 RepID=A0AA95NMY1_9BURK|nr:MmcQ/YjbR family DNA-binding protein [Paucibacter sp. S2-9]WIT12866.1 MmcQ/YjbR family DNA-binding protein [Paucibacter sp. S2-9]
MGQQLGGQRGWKNVSVRRARAGPLDRLLLQGRRPRFLELTGLPGLRPAPYAARYRWVQLQDPKALPLADLLALVSRSHALVFSKLTKKLQRELGPAIGESPRPKLSA